MKRLILFLCGLVIAVPMGMHGAMAVQYKSLKQIEKENKELANEIKEGFKAEYGKDAARDFDVYENFDFSKYAVEWAAMALTVQNSCYDTWLHSIFGEFNVYYKSDTNTYRMSYHTFVKDCMNAINNVSTSVYSGPFEYNCIKLLRSMGSDRDVCINALFDAIKWKPLQARSEPLCGFDVNEKITLPANEIRAWVDLRFAEYDNPYYKSPASARTHPDIYFRHDMRDIFINDYLYEFRDGTIYKPANTYTLSYANMAAACKQMLIHEIAKIRRSPMHPQYHDYVNLIPGTELAMKCSSILGDMMKILGGDCTDAMHDVQINPFFDGEY